MLLQHVRFGPRWSPDLKKLDEEAWKYNSAGLKIYKKTNENDCEILPNIAYVVHTEYSRRTLNFCLPLSACRSHQISACMTWQKRAEQYVRNITTLTEICFSHWKTMGFSFSLKWSETVWHLSPWFPNTFFKFLALLSILRIRWLSGLWVPIA